MKLIHCDWESCKETMPEELASSAMDWFRVKKLTDIVVTTYNEYEPDEYHFCTRQHLAFWAANPK